MKLKEIGGTGASHRHGLEHVTNEMILIPGRLLLKLTWKCRGAEDAKQFRKQIKTGEEPACQSSTLPQDSVGLVERQTRSVDRIKKLNRDELMPPLVALQNLQKRKRVLSAHHAGVIRHT